MAWATSRRRFLAAEMFPADENGFSQGQGPGQTPNCVRQPLILRGEREEDR